MLEPPASDPVTRIVLEELRALRTEMNLRLDRLVTTESFVDERLRVDQRYNALGQDIVDERTSRKADVKALANAQAKIAANVRWAFAAIVLPCAGLVTTIVLALRGGT